MIAYPSLQPRPSEKEAEPLFYSEKPHFFLDFAEKNRVQQLTLDTLTRTNHEKNVRTNMPLLNGIYHDQLLMEILEITNDMGYDAEITGLFAAQDKERRLPGVSIISEIERSTEPRAIEAHILRRIFANIKLTRRGSDQPTTKGCETCMAVAYHQRGIQVGFGTRVLYCQNQMLLNAECYVTTYPDDNAYKEVNIHELFSTIRDWLKNANQYVEKEQAVLKRWRKQKINQSQLMYVIGRLEEARVRADSNQLRQLAKSYPLGFGQIGDFVEEALTRLEKNEDKKITLWDIYDIATNLYKPWLMSEFTNILPQNKAMAEFTLEMERIFQTGMVEMPKPPKPVSEEDIDVLRSKLKDKLLRDIDVLCDEAKKANNIENFLKFCPVIALEPNEDK